LHALHIARGSARRHGWRETTPDRFLHPERPGEVLQIERGGYWSHATAGRVRGRGSARCLDAYIAPAPMITAAAFAAMLARVVGLGA
jgi:hypothetical protein